MNLTQFRKKYPEYDDMSDTQLADSLYKKHYSDIPRSEFDQKIGLQPKTFGQAYIEGLKDTGTGVATGAGNTWGGIQQLLSGAGKYGDKSLSDLQGMASQGKTLSPTEATNNVSNFQKELAQEYNRRMGKYEQAAERSPWLAGGGSIAGEAGTTIMPGLGQEAIALKALSKYPQLAQYVGKMLRGGTEGAAASGTQYAPEGTTNSGNAFTGGGIGTIASGALGAPGAIYNKLKPASLLRGELSPEQLLTNADAAKGTETHLGEILDNKYAKGLYENVLTELPLAGAAKTSQRAAKQVRDRADDVYSLISKAENPGAGDISGELLEGLRAGKKAVGAIKNQKYEAVNKKADELGVTVQRTNIANVANQKLKEIAEDEDLASEVPQEIIDKLKGYANPNRKSTFAGSDISRGKLTTNARKYAVEDPYISNIYADLKAARDLDIDESLAAYPELAAMRKDAHQFYKEKYAPFKQKSLAKFVNDFSADSDALVSKFFTPTKNGQERANRLGILTNAIDVSPNSDKLRAALRESIFSPAHNADLGMNPTKMSSIYKSIGSRQKEKLFPNNPEMVNELNKLQKVTGMNSDALNLLFNPPTGKRNLPWEALAAISTGITGGLATAGPLGAVAGGLAATGLGGGQYLTNRLTSEKYREDLINKMVNPKEGSKLRRTFTDELQKALSRGIAAKEAPEENKKESK